MTKEEKIIVSAYTGVLMCDFYDVHKYIEDKLGRPVWTHELADKDTQELIREKIRDDFMKLCREEVSEATRKLLKRYGGLMNGRWNNES